VIASEDELSLVVSDQQDELGLVAGDPQSESAAATRLAESGVGQLVITRGARGATLWQEGVAHHAPAIAVTVLDTIGAGDAFAAGYLSGILDHLGPAEALRRGTLTGAFAVASIGDWEGLPTREELSLLDTEAGTTLR
jgi:2-dehydro-3-deoxygluconokinase